MDGPPPGHLSTTSGPTSQTARPSATIEQVWAALAVAVPVVVSLASTMITTDLAYHIRLGDEIVRSGSIPATDTMTFTMFGHGWVDQQWGAQVILALGHRWGGWAALTVLRALAIGTIYALVYLSARARGATSRAASILSIGAFAIGARSLALRPQLFALVLVAFTLWTIAGRRAHPGRMWWAAAAAAVASNLHGSFVLIPGLLTLATIDDLLARDRRWRHTLAIAVAAGAATLVNPLGPDVWVYAYDIATNPIIRTTITEWNAVSPLTLAGAAFFATAIAVAIVALRRRPPAWGALMWIAAFTALTAPARRGLVTWGMVAALVVADLWATRGDADDGAAPAPAPDRSEPRRLNAAILAVLVLAVVALLPWWHGTGAQRLLRGAPIGLTEALTRDAPPSSAVFVAQNWASWLEFAAPGYPVHVDSRIELFPADVWDEYHATRLAGADALEVLDRRGVDAVIAPDTPAWPIVALLREDPGWREAYADTDGVLFVRST